MSTDRRALRGPNWIKAYTVERVTQFFLFPVYNVVFEEKPLLQTSSKETAERVAGLCNGAYNLGRASVATQLWAEQYNENTSYLGVQ